MEQISLFFLKPNVTINLQLMEQVIKKIEDLTGGHVVDRYIFKVDYKYWLKFYEHVPSPNREEHCRFVSEGPICLCVITGEDIVSRLRKAIGATNAHEASPETIRGWLARIIPEKNPYRNYIHASDSLRSFAREYTFLKLIYHQNKIRSEIL